jgi:hypothetical protein
VLLAQSFGEYGGGGLLAHLATLVESAAQWVQLSLRENRSVWIAAVVCVAIVLWLFRRR